MATAILRLMATGKPKAKKRSAAGCLTLVILGAALIFLYPYLQDLIDTPFHPWAHSLGGKSTLVGSWVGPVAMPSGRKMVLLLEMNRSRKSNGDYASCGTNPCIEGAAQLCGGGEIKDYEIWGGPDTWSGARFHLKSSSVGPARPGLQLGDSEGEWAGDQLSLSTAFSYFNEKGEPRGGDERDRREPIKFTLRRGGKEQFLIACQETTSN